MSQPDYPSQPSAGFDALFDLSFTRFITIGLIKVIYILAMVMLALAWLGFVIGGLRAGFIGFLIAIIFGTLGAILYLLMIRVWLELIVVLFRIGENTSIMAGRSLNPEPAGFPVTPMSPAV